ncbi:sugar phosphate nucleotidyltransferase [Natronorubrum tibetense]|nr:sugar phosphate nucleotidyltransferase [Natronorubrum tibetense]
MHALVFAAGRGTRLRPYTDRTPKPLLEIAGEPLLVRTLRSVVDAGVDGIVIVVGYRAGDVIDTVGSVIDGVPIRYAVQDDREGLAHAVCTAFEEGYGVFDPDTIEEDEDGALPTDVLTVNGDNVFDDDCDLSRLVDRHHEPDVDGTLLLDRVARNEAETTARCVLDDDGTVRSLESSTSEPESGYIAGGVQTHDARTLFEACHTVERSDTGEYELADALEDLIADGNRYVGVDFEGWHLNVNTPADLKQARKYLGADGSTG